MSPVELVTLREAADRLGVHYMTAYRYVRTGRLPASKLGAEWRVRVDDLTAFSTRPARSPNRPARDDYAGLLLDRLLAGDEGGAWRVVDDALTGGADPGWVYTDLITPALHEVGERWAAGKIDVAEEHQASAVVSRLLGRLGPRFARAGRKRGTIVLGSVAGDLHSLPTALLADLLRGAGHQVHDLGANTPVASFAHAAAGATRLCAVGICATVVPDPAVVGDTISALRAATRVPILLGGGAIPDAAARLLGADGWADSAAEAVAVFEAVAADPTVLQR